MSRVLLILLAIPLILILAAAILIPLLLDKETILELAAQEVYKQTGATLTVKGDVDLTVFPSLGLALGDVSLEMPAEQHSSLQARGLDISVQLMPLLSKQVEIDGISLDGVVIKMETAPPPASVDTSKLSNEELDAFYAARRKALDEAGDSAGAEAALAVPLALNVRKLSISDSRLELTEAGGETTVVELLNMEATGLNLDGRPIPLDLSIRLAGEEPLELDVQGTVLVDQETQIVGLESLDVVVRGATAQALKLETSGQVDINRQVADLNLKASLGDTRAQGQLRYASFESPQIDTQLKLNLLDPALLALSGPEAASAASETTGSDEGGASGDTPLPLDAIRPIDSRANLTIDRVVLEGHTIENLKLLVRAKDGVLRIPKLTGTLHGGELSAKAVFDGKHNIATMNTQGSLKALDIATALAAVESEPVLTGKADMDWNLESRGATVNELVAQLTGPITVVGNDAVLQEMGVEQMFCEGVALVNQQALSASFPASSSFKSLSVDVKMSGGKANLTPLRAELAGISLIGQGYLELESQHFDTTLKARLSPELGELDPACRVNQRITSIDWPVACKGELSGEPDDWCAVNTSDVVEDLATQEVERKVQKEVEEKFGEDAGKLLKNIFGK